MKIFKVLGPGCKNCKNTARLIEEVAEKQGEEVSVVKVTEMEKILGYGVISTPGVVQDEIVVHSGSVPTSAQVVGWLQG